MSNSLPPSLSSAERIHRSPFIELLLIPDSIGTLVPHAMLVDMNVSTEEAKT